MSVEYGDDSKRRYYQKVEKLGIGTKDTEHDLEIGTKKDLGIEAGEAQFTTEQEKKEAPMKCPKCSHEAPDDSKFCNECGTKLDVVCSECRTANPPGSIPVSVSITKCFPSM